MMHGDQRPRAAAVAALHGLQFLAVGMAALVIGLHVLRQPIINVLNVERSTVTGVVVAATIAALVPVLAVVVARAILASHRVRWSETFTAALPWSLHLVLWVLLAVAALAWGLAPWQYVATSLYYHAFASALVVVPRALARPGAVGLARAGVFLLMGVLVFACLQAVIPAARMPSLLQPDGRSYIGTNALGVPRVNGLIGNPIEFAYFAVLTLHLFNALRWNAVARGIVTSAWLRFGTVAALVSLVLASSRLNLVAAVAVLLVWRWRRARWIGRSLLLVAALAAAAYAAWPGSYVHQMFFNWSTTASTALHFEESSAAFARFLEAPWFGHGVGTETGPGSIITDGLWWAVAVEAGIVGVVTLLAVLVAPAIHVVRLGWSKTGRWRRFSDRQVLVIGTSVFAVGSGLINSALYNPNNVLLTFLLLGTAYLPGDAAARDG